jgi:hypothetical protein
MGAMAVTAALKGELGAKSFSFSSFFVLYGMLIGLLAVASYQNFTNVSDLLNKEAASLSPLYWNVRAYPQPMRRNLQEGLRDYTSYVIEQSWPLQQKGIVGSEGTHRITQFSDVLMSFDPASKKEEIIHAESLRQLNHFLELRQEHLGNVTTCIPEVLWGVMALGAFISIVLLAMFSTETHIHPIFCCSLSAFLGVVIFTIAALDNPFRGAVSVGPEPFQDVYESLMKPNAELSAAMRELMSTTQKLAAPRVEGNHQVAARPVRGLFFGMTLVNNTVDLVDAVAHLPNSSATLFVRDGDDFVRVSTNIKKSDRARAIGTVLDPNGPAIAAIKRGNAYFGAATILGKPYNTAYEPIRDVAGNIMGLYYVGFAK